MTVIRPNSISGITSITAQANEINVFKHDGVLAGLQLNGVNHHTSSGVSTFHTLNVLGNVSIGGTLTYEDVTNVDSVGVITARDDINIVSDAKKLNIGADADLQLHHTSGHSYIDDAGSGNLRLRSGTLEITNLASNKTSAVFSSGSGQTLNFNDNTKFITTNTGVVITGICTATSFSGDGSNLTGLNTDLVNDSSPQLGANLDVNGANILFGDSSAAGTNLNRLKFGTHTDLHIWHNSGTGNSNISAYSGDLYIQGNNGSGTGQNQIAIKSNAAVELNYQGTKKFETLSYGVQVHGAITASNNINTGNNTAKFMSGAQNQLEMFCDGSRGHVRTTAAISLKFSTNSVERFDIQSDGHFVPQTNNAFDIGTSSFRIRNIYTNDLNLSNKGSTNSVDNTWGDYTIQEGESDLFLINNRSGKKYKFNLTEVS